MTTSGSYYWRWPESDGSALRKRLKFYNFCLRRTKSALTKSELPNRLLSRCLAGKLKEFKIFCPQMRWMLLPPQCCTWGSRGWQPSPALNSCCWLQSPCQKPQGGEPGWLEAVAEPTPEPTGKQIPWLCTGFLGQGKSGCTVQMLNYVSIRMVFPRQTGKTPMVNMCELK